MGDTKTDLLEATGTVLTREGFHGLTTQKVADERDVSHSLVHYHFETKADLVAAFLDHYREEFGAMLSPLESLPPGERLPTFLAVVVAGTDHESIRALNLAVYELQAHAARHDVYQEALERYGQFVRGFLADCIEAGVEAGTFTDVDPASTASLLLSALDGAMLSTFTTGTDDVERVAYEALPSFVLANLYVGDPPDLRSYVADVDLGSMADAEGDATAAQDGSETS